MIIKKCENCKWWQGVLREYDDLGKFRKCYESGSIISINSEDSCNKFEFNGVQLPYIKKKIEKTKLKKATTMMTKSGVKIYISSVSKKINEVLENETSHVKILQEDLNILKKRKPLGLSGISRAKYLRKEIERSTTEITIAERHKKRLTLNRIEKDIDKLKKHPDIIGVETEKDGFIIYTKPLTVGKKEIGHYEINLSYRYLGRIRIYNLHKNRIGGSNDHWFIEGGIPCFGEWGKGLKKYAYSGNIYLVIDTIIRFLTSKYHSEEGYLTFTNFTKNYL